MQSVAIHHTPWPSWLIRGHQRSSELISTPARARVGVAAACAAHALPRADAAPPRPQLRAIRAQLSAQRQARLEREARAPPSAATSGNQWQPMAISGTQERHSGLISGKRAWSAPLERLEPGSHRACRGGGGQLESIDARASDALIELTQRRLEQSGQVRPLMRRKLDVHTAARGEHRRRLEHALSATQRHRPFSRALRRAVERRTGAHNGSALHPTAARAEARRSLGVARRADATWRGGLGQHERLVRAGPCAYERVAEEHHLLARGPLHMELHVTGSQWQSGVIIGNQG